MLSRRAATVADSRWWYWAAGVPVVVGFWLLAVAWLAVAVTASPEVLAVERGPVAYALSVSLVAFGVPVFVLLLVLPFALYRDALAVDAHTDWTPDATAYSAAALAGLALAVLGGAASLLDVAGDAGFAALAGGLVAGGVVATGVALHYLRARRRCIGEP